MDVPPKSPRAHATVRLYPAASYTRAQRCPASIDAADVRSWPSADVCSYRRFSFRSLDLVFDRALSEPESIRLRRLLLRTTGDDTLTGCSVGR